MIQVRTDKSSTYRRFKLTRISGALAPAGGLLASLTKVWAPFAFLVIKNKDATDL